MQLSQVKVLDSARADIALFKNLQRGLSLEERRRAWTDQFDPMITGEFRKELREILRKDFSGEVKGWLNSQHLDRMRNDFGLYEQFTTDIILAPIMVSGFGFGSETAAHLERIHNKAFDFVLLGYPRKPEKCEYRGGGHMELGRMHMADEDAEFLKANNKRPIFVLDDFVYTGVTLEKVMEGLYGLGFREIFHHAQFYSDGPLSRQGRIGKFAQQ